MDDIQLPGTLPGAPPPMDPATRAFTELKGELALLRRAIEHVSGYPRAFQTSTSRLQSAPVRIHTRYDLPATNPT